MAEDNDPKTSQPSTEAAAEDTQNQPLSDTSPAPSSSASPEWPIDTPPWQRKGRRPDGKFQRGKPSTATGKRKGKSSDPEKAERHGRTVTHVLYEAMWEAWRDGNRSKRALSKMFRCSWETVHRIVEKGSPRNNWTSLRERTKIWDAQQFQAQQTAAATTAIQQTDEYQKARAEQLKISQAGKAGIAILMRKLAIATQNATFVRQRKTTDKSGNTIMVDVPPDAHELAHTAQKLVQGLTELGKHESFWLGGPTERPEITGALSGVLSLPEDKLLAIIENGGALPDGVTDEQLFGKASN